MLALRPPRQRAKVSFEGATIQSCRDLVCRICNPVGVIFVHGEVDSRSDILLEERGLHGMTDVKEAEKCCSVGDEAHG